MKSQVKSEYEIQADNFLINTGTTFKAEKIGNYYYFDGDKVKRDVYEITLKRNKKEHTFKFGQSIFNSGPQIKERGRIKAPTAYDVLVYLQKYDIGTLDNFCSDFGYDTDSKKATEIYFKVQEEYNNVCLLFHDVIDDLVEIS